MNKFIGIGRLTVDPELRQTQSGVAVCRFTIAINRRFKDKQTGEYTADFINCQAWRQTAEFISKYFGKGDMVAVEGTLQTGKYQDKNYQAVTHYTTDVIVENVEFCGSKSNNQKTSAKNEEPYTADTSDLSAFEEILGDGVVPF